MLRDRPLFGFLLGVLATALGLVIIYLVLYRPGLGLTPSGFVRMMRYPSEASKALSLALLANIVPITLVKRRRLNEAARGLFVVIMLCALLILWLRFV